jgi:predicted Zn finger-like uncharacterized protein
VQANCPQCAQKIVIDDARVPERAFSVKCPKCQNTVKFPGRGTPASSPAAAPAVPDHVGDPGAEASSASSAPVPPGGEDMRAQLMAQLRREMSMPAADAGSSGRALVALPDRGLAGSITVMLTRLGFVVDTIDDSDEAARFVEQGVYTVALTARLPPTPGKETLFQRIGRLSPDNRRRLFLVLVGDEWKSGDGLQAWGATADLVLNTREAAAADVLLRMTMQERSRVYQAFVDARHRLEAAG